MKFIKPMAIHGLVAAMLVLMMASTQVYAFAEGTLLRREMQNADVKKLQQDLHTLGLLTVNPTGFFGSLTESAVMQFQRQVGLTPDGVAGPKTLSQLMAGVSGNEKRLPPVSRGSFTRASITDEIQLRPWFGDIERFFARGDVATIIDVNTGLSFKVQRTFGTNHADVEAVSKEDTAMLKQIAGGEWNWVRRPIIVEVHGARLAASMTAMPHAGLDHLPALQTVSNRSGGFGRGINLDEIKGNGMDGHFDIHFLNSKTHGTNSVDAAHQKAIKEAANVGL